jgi:hypothetical protein
MKTLLEKLDKAIRKHFPNAEFKVTTRNLIGADMPYIEFNLFPKEYWPNGILGNDPGHNKMIIRELGPDKYSIDTEYLRVYMAIDKTNPKHKHYNALHAEKITIPKKIGTEDEIVKHIGRGFSKFAALVIKHEDGIRTNLANKKLTPPDKYFQVKAKVRREFFYNNPPVIKDKATASSNSDTLINEDDLVLTLDYLLDLSEEMKDKNIIKFARELKKTRIDAADEYIEMMRRKLKFFNNFKFDYDDEDKEELDRLSMLQNDIENQIDNICEMLNIKKHNGEIAQMKIAQMKAETAAPKAKAPAKKAVAKRAAKAAPKGKSALKKTPQPDKTKVILTVDQVYILGKTIQDLTVMTKPPFNFERLNKYLINWTAIHGKPLLLNLMNAIAGHSMSVYHNKSNVNNIVHAISNDLYETNFNQYNFRANRGEKKARDVRIPFVSTGNNMLDEIAMQLLALAGHRSAGHGILNKGALNTDTKQYIEKCAKLKLPQMKKVAKSVIGPDYISGGSDAAEVFGHIMDHIQKRHEKHYKAIIDHYDLPGTDDFVYKNGTMRGAINAYNDEVREKNISSLGKRVVRY